jgi:hypothetical protein
MIDVSIALNCDDFYTHYLQDDADFTVGKFYEMRGEQKIVINPWQDPDEADQDYSGTKITKTRTMSLEVQIKNNPFVKVAPTTRAFKMIENTSESLHFKILNRNHDVPYCDCFGVEEEWWVASPPGAKCAALRISYGILWYKSSMMKSIIRSNTESESKMAFEAL